MTTLDDLLDNAMPLISVRQGAGSKTDIMIMHAGQLRVRSVSPLEALQLGQRLINEGLAALGRLDHDVANQPAGTDQRRAPDAAGRKDGA